MRFRFFLIELILRTQEPWMAPQKKAQPSIHLTEFWHLSIAMGIVELAVASIVWTFLWGHGQIAVVWWVR